MRLPFRGYFLVDLHTIRMLFVYVLRFPPILSLESIATRLYIITINYHSLSQYLSTSTRD